MSLEVAIVPRTRVPKSYTKILKKAAEDMSSAKGIEQALAVTGDNSESYDTIRSCWREVCHSIGRDARSKYKKHELGFTVFLWWE